MALDYHRNFNAGRGSDQLMNEELHKTVESVRHLLDVPEGSATMPNDLKLNGSLWLDLNKNELNYYQRDKDAMVNIFANKFCITDHLMDDLPPADPVPGTFWISNGALMYFDGTTWAPIKAIAEDGSQFNIAAFEDFSLISPLQAASNTVVDDIDSTEETFRKAVLEGKLDPENNAQWLETDEKFGPNWTLTEQTYTEATIPPDVMCQFAVPNTTVGRFFVNGLYEPNVKKINGICIQYPKLSLVDKVPSFVHVNPGKVSKVTKHIFKINKLNPRIAFSAANTEFYGFKKDSHYGAFLRSGADQDHGDYICVPEGINLNYNASQNFDYVVAVSYDFSWVRSTGRMSVSDSSESTSSYYLGDYGGPLDVFVEGYNMENNTFDYDSESRTVNFEDEIAGLEVSVMRSAKHEYGFIRETTLDGRGIIKLLDTFTKPLVFINGEAVHPSLGDLEIDGDKIYVVGAQRNMAWSVMELDDILKNGDMFYAAGKVTDSDNEGNGHIMYDPALITANDGMVLFIDGLLVKKEDIIRNEADQWITVSGLTAGQEYILLKDKYHNLYAENSLVPAFKTGRIDESLVYIDGQLICNDTVFVTTSDKTSEAKSAVNGEMKLFLASALDRTIGEFAVWDSYNKAWQPMDAEDQTALMTYIKSYENSLRAVKLDLPFDKDTQKMFAFAFSYASSVGETLKINSKNIEAGTMTVSLDGNSFPINTNSLSVWMNGIRLFEGWQPGSDQQSFDFNCEATDIPDCKITYCIEKPEKGNDKACIPELLTEKNLVEGTSNVYRTVGSLYPGRVTVYVSGLRQPKESWTIIDNNTILFKDQTTKLISSEEEEIIGADGKISIIPHSVTDKILVEVRQEFMRKERTITWTETDNWDIDVEKYDLPLDILEAQDEILIFVDGTYTGLRSNFGYRIDRVKGCITILDGEVINMLCKDELASYFAIHPEAAATWQKQHNGVAYTPVISHQITLEWR